MPNEMPPENRTIMHLRSGGVIGLAPFQDADGRPSVALRVLGELAGVRADSETVLTHEEILLLVKALTELLSPVPAFGAGPPVQSR